MGCPIATDRDVFFGNVGHVDRKSQRDTVKIRLALFFALSHTDRMLKSCIIPALACCSPRLSNTTKGMITTTTSSRAVSSV